MTKDEAQSYWDNHGTRYRKYKIANDNGPDWVVVSYYNGDNHSIVIWRSPACGYVSDWMLWTAERERLLIRRAEEEVLAI